MEEKMTVIRRFFQLLENFETDLEAFRDLLHPDIEQVEFPNLVTKNKRTNTLQDLGAGMAAGRKLLCRQQFAIRRAFDCPPDACVVEQIWTGEVGAGVGPFQAGQVLTAYICTVFEFRDGRIYRQRNYDCYEPF